MHPVSSLNPLFWELDKTFWPRERESSLCTEDGQNVLDDVFGCTETAEQVFSQEE